MNETIEYFTRGAAEAQAKAVLERQPLERRLRAWRRLDQARFDREGLPRGLRQF